MTAPPAEGYYAARSARMLRGFDRASKRFARSLERHHDAAFAEEVLRDARIEFERLLPELPYIGGRRNVFSWVMVVNGWLVALFRAMQARGKSAEETIRVAADVADELFRSLPGAVLRLVGRLAFTRPVRGVLRRQAERSQERRFAADLSTSTKRDRRIRSSRPVARSCSRTTSASTGDKMAAAWLSTHVCHRSATAFT